MDEKPTRRELAAEYKSARRDAGVFRILNGVSGRSLIGTTQNLASARNKFSFAVSTDSPAALDYRLKSDVEAVGLALSAVMFPKFWPGQRFIGKLVQKTERRSVAPRGKHRATGEINADADHVSA